MTDPHYRLLQRLVHKAEIGYPPFQDRPDSPWRNIDPEMLPNELRGGRS